MRTLMAIVGGAILGAGAALLLAPDPGAVTRSKLREKAGKYGHDAAGFAESKGRHLRNKMEGYAHHAEEAVHKAQGAVLKAQEVVERAGEVMPKVQNMVDHAVDAMQKARAARESRPEPEPTTV